MEENRGRVWHVVGVICMAIALQTLFVLCLNVWQNAYFWLLLFCGTAVNFALFFADLICYFRDKQLAYRAMIITYVLLIFALAVLYFMLDTGFFQIVRDGERLREYLERAGAWMSFAFILLQFLQVVILPIPSTVTVVAGSALFGPLLGSIYSLIGIFLGSLVAFLVGRYAGYRVVCWLVGKETLDKWLKKIKGKDKLLLSAMFILPVFPDDILCFVAGLSSMSLWQFVAIIALARVLGIFTTSYSVSLIPFNTWWGIAIWAVLFVAVGALFVVLYKKADAIEEWIFKKLRRETRIEKKIQKEEFVLEVINPDGAVVSKGVKKEEKEGQKTD